jgi:transcriptional regulator with PAS, ATPase and Fis domain
MSLPTGAKRSDDYEIHPRSALSNLFDRCGLIGESPPMHRLYELIEKAARSTATVLLIGDTGTGKELVARAIHFSGLRHEKTFGPVDCSALTSTLIESELFGHVKGAFTGADRSKPGLLQAANKGTLFLDEIGELPMSLQAKLLRALQEHEIRPVGSTQPVPIDVRVIAATNRDLEAGVRAGTFRQDLYFRLNVIQIRLPALRERKADIPLLVGYFLKNFSEPLKPVREISDDALRRLMAHDWPGNVRELENVIECAVALGSEPIVRVPDLPLRFASAFVELTIENSKSAPVEKAISLAEVERGAILRALCRTQGDRITAAHLLHISKTTLYRKLKQYSHR